MQNFAENKSKDFCLVYYSRKKPIHYIAARHWKKCGEAIAHLNESWPTLSRTFFPEGPGALRKVLHRIIFSSVFRPCTLVVTLVKFHKQEFCLGIFNLGFVGRIAFFFEFAENVDLGLRPMMTETGFRRCAQRLIIFVASHSRQ